MVTKNLLQQLNDGSRHWRNNLRNSLKEIATSFGYERMQWSRIVMYRELFDVVQSFNPAQLNALEISAGHVWQRLNFRSFTELQYPDFDICQQALNQTFDLIIADQVFEHLLYPYRAGKNIYQMLAPGGYFIVTTPFLIRVHGCPVDCSRWTETGIQYFLAECGFSLENIQTGAWGNRACVKANLKPYTWAEWGWRRSLHNEPDYPVVVWAIARK